jgi:hypothetical protein
LFTLCAVAFLPLRPPFSPPDFAPRRRRVNLACFDLGYETK